ncbi:hypothetical protein HK098_001969 [Nowakowskiella sp. JEL0407]|nr:hypothetical protein HK098_001969 [Nowakowskiella sp. JEL0407]
MWQRIFLSSLLFSVSHALKLSVNDENKCVAPPLGDVTEQCEFIKAHCSDGLSGYIDYLQFYYCSNFQLLPFLCLIIILALLFLMLSTAASEFLAVNLSNISNWLRLSETVSGVTLAAFGNGAPDLFSTYSAFSNNIASLALGELMGAASFISLVVVGMVAIIHPFQLPKRPFLRDISFFMVAIMSIIYVVHDGKVTFWEGLAFVVYYCAYVVIVVGGHIASLKKEEEIPVVVDDNYDDDVEEANETTNLLSPNSHLHPTPTLEEVYDAHFYQDLKPVKRRVSENSSIYSTRSRHLVIHELTTTLPNSNQMYHSPVINEQEEEEVLASYTPEKVVRTSIISRLGSLRDNVFPIFVEWDDEMSGFERGMLVLNTPIYALYRLTIPLISNEEMEGGDSGMVVVANTEEVEVLGSNGDEGFEVPVKQERIRAISKELVILQCLIVPIFVAVLVLDFEVLNVIILGIFGVLLATAAYFLLKKIPLDKLGKGVSVVGFLMAIVWIYGIVAGELVNLLNSLGIILGLSPTIIGMTIMALGNSVGDFMTNIAIARMGYPAMAIGACYGSPMLNIVLGVGVTATILTYMSAESYSVTTTPTFFASAFGLLIMLGLSALYIPLNDYKVTRRFGMLLIGLFPAEIVKRIQKKRRDNAQCKPCNEAILETRRWDGKELAELINMKTELEETPLHIAVERDEDNDLVHHLLSLGAHANIQNKDGDTALHCAIKSKTVANEGSARFGFRIFGGDHPALRALDGAEMDWDLEMLQQTCSQYRVERESISDDEFHSEDSDDSETEFYTEFLGDELD